MSNISSGSRPVATGWVGWVGFAGLMMMITGVMNAISGIAAIAKDQVFVHGGDNVLLLDLTTFGWIHLALGVLITVAGFFVLRGAVWATVVAIIVTSLNLLTQMMQLPAYPFWSLLIITVDLIVLWALMVHSGEMRSLE